MSFSKYNVSCLNDTLYSGLTSPNPARRPRQNSVFVGSSTMAFMNPPRRVKSAIDIQHLILNDPSPTSVSSCNSMLPMITSYRDRKPSITIERPSIYPGRRRPSVATDRPMLSQHYYARNRRPSCCADRSSYFGRHRNFISFDQPTISLERRTSIAIERPSCIVHQPTVSFETPSESLERPFFVVDPPSINQDYPLTNMSGVPTHMPFRKMSLSFEQPSVSIERPRPRMATSLDINSINFARRSSMPDADRASPVSINLDETKAPLLESLKSSDV
ncbi:hypothetical protein ILUMI_24025 [Ignelater luminosus]|uniref:Fibronectin type III domain-containing protein n=1 Tax=Ignelater luminosus TaxID=2038154 RepID=A0A8K0C7T3_IGNLU|nr:hypothetical protein ILUMI_24025 [Ignelater luminosus]